MTDLGSHLLAAEVEVRDPALPTGLGVTIAMTEVSGCVAGIFIIVGERLDTGDSCVIGVKVLNVGERYHMDCGVPNPGLRNLRLELEGIP